MTTHPMAADLDPAYGGEMANPSEAYKTPPYGYATITYICVDCRWQVTIRTRTDPMHSVTYSQAISPDRCFRCRQRKGDGV
jgi:hypothetical protein